MKKIYVTITLASALIFSCKKEAVNTFNGSENLIEFENHEDYQTKLDEFKNMEFDYLYNSVLDDNTIVSEIVKIQKVFLDTNTFASREELLDFVKNNSELLKIETIEGEDELITLYEDNPNIYFADKTNRMFKIGNNVYKVLEDGTIYTKIENFDQLKSCNLKSVAEVNNSKFKIFDSYSTEIVPNKSSWNYYFNHHEDRVICGNGVKDIYKTGVSTRGQQNRTRLYLMTYGKTFNKMEEVPMRDTQGNDMGTVHFSEQKRFYVDCKIRNAVRAWRVWVYANRTTTANVNLTVNTRINSGPWEPYTYSRSIHKKNHVIEEKIDELNVTGFTFNYFISSFNVTFKTPNIPQTTAGCN